MAVHYIRTTTEPFKPVVTAFAWQSDWHPAGPAPLPPVAVTSLTYQGEEWEVTAWTELQPADEHDQARGYRWLARECRRATPPKYETLGEALVMTQMRGGMGVKEFADGD